MVAVLVLRFSEDRIPVVLSENRESSPSSVNPEVLGEARETAHEETKPIPDVLGAERRGRGKPRYSRQYRYKNARPKKAEHFYSLIFFSKYLACQI